MSALPLCQKPISTESANSTVKSIGDNSSYHLPASNIVGLVVAVVTFSFVLIGVLFICWMRRRRRKVHCSQVEADYPDSHELAGEPTKEKLPSRCPRPGIVPVNASICELNCESRTSLTIGAKQYHEMDTKLPTHFTNVAGFPHDLATCQELEAQQGMEIQNIYEARNQATERQRTEERHSHCEQVWQSVEELKGGDYEKTNAPFILDTPRGDIGEEVEDGLSRPKLASPLRLPNNTKDTFNYAEFSKDENRVVQSCNDSTNGNRLTQAGSTRVSIVGNSDMRRPVKRKGSRELKPNLFPEVQKPRQTFQPPPIFRRLLPRKAPIQDQDYDTVYGAQIPQEGFDGRRASGLPRDLPNSASGVCQSDKSPFSTGIASNYTDSLCQMPSSSPLHCTVGISESPNQSHAEKQPSASPSTAFQYHPPEYHLSTSPLESSLSEEFRGSVWGPFGVDPFPSEVHPRPEHHMNQLAGQNIRTPNNVSSGVLSPESSPSIASPGMSSCFVSPSLPPRLCSERWRINTPQTPRSQHKDSAEQSQEEKSPSSAMSSIRPDQHPWSEKGQEPTAHSAADLTNYSADGNMPNHGYLSV